MPVSFKPVNGDKLVFGEEFEIIIEPFDQADRDFHNSLTSEHGPITSVNIAYSFDLRCRNTFFNVVDRECIVEDNGYRKYSLAKVVTNIEEKLTWRASIALDSIKDYITSDNPTITFLVDEGITDGYIEYSDGFRDDFMQLFGGDDNADGDVYLGETLTHTFYVPDSVVPEFSFSIDDWNSMYANYGVYPRTKTTITGTATGAYGAYIKSIEWRAGTGTNFKVLNSTILEANSEYLTSRVKVNDAHGYYLLAYVTDSRDRQKLFQVGNPNSKIFVDYAEPAVTITGAYRCDENGDASEDGACGAIVFNAACRHDVSAALAKAKYQICYRKSDTNDNYLLRSIPELNGQKTVNSYKAVLPLDTSYSYQVAIFMHDGIMQVRTNTKTIPNVAVFIEFDKENNSIGLGSAASRKDTLTVGIKTEFIKGTNLITPVSVCLSASNWAILDGVYTNTFSIPYSVLSGVPLDALVFVSPTLDSFECYCECGIRLTTVNSLKLTFICDTAPSEDIYVNIAILKP